MDCSIRILWCSRNDSEYNVVEKLTKQLTRSQKLNQELRKRFLDSRKLMKTFPTHRELMKKLGKAQTE